MTEVFRTHTVTTYPAPKSPGHQHWVSTSLGRHADAAAARILPAHDTRGFWLGGFGLLPGPHSARRGRSRLYWEHHVLGSALMCPRLWRRRGALGGGWSKMGLSSSEADQTLAGSYALFARLRSAGIRAHSWV